MNDKYIRLKRTSFFVWKKHHFFDAQDKEWIYSSSLVKLQIYLKLTKKTNFWKKMMYNMPTVELCLWPGEVHRKNGSCQMCLVMRWLMVHGVDAILYWCNSLMQYYADVIVWCNNMLMQQYHAILCCRVANNGGWLVVTSHFSVSPAICLYIHLPVILSYIVCKSVLFKITLGISIWCVYT